MVRRPLLVIFVGLALAGLPASGAWGLSIVPTLSGPMTLSHDAGARSSTSLAVVSLATWSLTIADTSGTSPGFLKPCTLTGGQLVGSVTPGGTHLSQGLRFSTSSAALTDASLYQALGSGTQSAGSGSLTQTKTVFWYQPALTNSDSVAGGSGFCTQITYTVTETS